MSSSISYKEYCSNIYIQNTPPDEWVDFYDTVALELRVLESAANGNELIDKIKNGAYRVFIQYGKENRARVENRRAFWWHNQKGTGSGTFITYYPVWTESKSRQTFAFIHLAHLLAHAYRNSEGENKWLVSPSRDAADLIEMENSIREDHKISPREASDFEDLSCCGDLKQARVETPR